MSSRRRLRSRERARLFRFSTWAWTSPDTRFRSSSSRLSRSSRARRNDTRSWNFSSVAIFSQQMDRTSRPSCGPQLSIEPDSKQLRPAISGRLREECRRERGVVRKVEPGGIDHVQYLSIGDGTGGLSMQYRPLGKTGIKVSEVGFGAWGIGGTWWIGAQDAESIAALHAAIDAGVNFIDTALVYGDGHSEE